MLIAGPHADGQLASLTYWAVDHINKILIPVLLLPIGKEGQ
jgi:hypothetical protein